MKRKNVKFKRKGFTLIELLIVVAIIAILVCIGIVMVNPKEISLVEYNRCAESIATAVQNRLTALRNAGQLADLGGLGDGAKYSNAEGVSLESLGMVSDPPEPSTPEEPSVTEGASDEYRYIFSYNEDKSPNSNIRYFVPFGSIELQLEQSYYAIGFQAKSGMVGEVFYSKEPFAEYSVSYLKKLSDVAVDKDGTITIEKGKNSTERKKAGVGYYVGEVDSQEVAPAQLPTPQLTITNNEELTLSIYLPKVRELDKYNKKLALRICLVDAAGDAFIGNKLSYESTTIYTTIGKEGGLEMGQSYSLILDTPDPDLKFDSAKAGENVQNLDGLLSSTNVPKACFETWAHRTEAYRGTKGNDYFRLGDNVQIKVTVFCLDNENAIDTTYMERSASVVFNGWFDTYDGDHTVTIATGRHLQNLGYLTEMNATLEKLLPELSIETESGTVYTYKNYSRGNAYKYTDTVGKDNINKKWDYRSQNGHIVRDDITVARQVKSIDFDNEIWKKGGKSIPFTPVNLASGFTYYGNYQTIRHLWVDAPFYAGLFGYAYNVRLYDIMLINPHVESHMPAYVAEIYEMGVGALIGTSRDSQYIYNCQAYMEAEGNEEYDKLGEKYRILGNCYVGGLIGFCEDENIRQNSASVYTGNNDGSSLYVGGLIGCITGDSNVKRCYGAGNLSGQYVGGLIGVVMEDSNSAGDNYYIQSCYTAGHIVLATKSAAGLIGRIWEQGGYYKSALGANSNYCVVIYGKVSGGNYSWADSYVRDYKVQADGTFAVSKEHEETPTPIYGTFEGDGFEWLYSSEIGYFTGSVNGEDMFLGADFHSDNQNYFIPQKGLEDCYKDSPYFTEVKTILNGLVSELKEDGLDRTKLQNTVDLYRNRLRYAKLSDALEELKGELENLIYELKCEEAGNSEFKNNSVLSKVQNLYDGTFTTSYTKLKEALEKLKKGEGGQTEKETVAKYLTTDDNSDGIYDTVFRYLRDTVFTAGDDTTQWFVEARVKDRIRYYLHTMDNTPDQSTLSNELKAELQRQKLLGLQSALKAATAINTLAKDDNKWNEADKMKPYKDFIKELSDKAIEKLEKLIELVEGESYKAYTQDEKAKYNKEGITLEYDDYSTTTPEELQALINEAYGYYNDLYRLFDAKATDSVSLSKYSIALLLGVNPNTIKEGEDYDERLKGFFNDKGLHWSDSSYAWKMTGGVKDIVDVAADGKKYEDPDKDDYGMRTLRDALSANDARGSIQKAGVELNSGVEGELDRIEYMCKLAEYYQAQETPYKNFNAEILDCISDIETMLGIDWEGHDSGHRIYSAYELRQIRDSSVFDAINHDFVYKYNSLDDYKDKGFGGYVDEEGVYNNVFPYEENNHTHYYPFLFVEGLEVQGASAATDILFHYGDWLTDDLWAKDPATKTGDEYKSHKYHSGNSAADKLNEMNRLLDLLEKLSNEGENYWEDDMKHFKSNINELVTKAKGDITALQTAIGNYQTAANEENKGALEEALETAWGSYNDLWMYLSSDYTIYPTDKKIGDITSTTVVKENGQLVIANNGKISDLVKLINDYKKSFYNTVAKACGLPTISEEMEDLWRMDLQLKEVQKTIELWKNDSTMGKYYDEAKALVDAAETALGEFITVANKSKSDTEYKEKFNEARMAYWYAYSFFDDIKNETGKADRFGTVYSYNENGGNNVMTKSSSRRGMRRLRAVFGSDSGDAYKSPLDKQFGEGQDLPTWDELNRLRDLKNISRQVADLQKVTDPSSDKWTEESGMKAFKEEVAAVLEKLQSEISAIFEEYDSGSEGMQNALIEAFKYCDYLYRYFDDDSRYNATGVQIKNVVDALDSTGKTEAYNGGSSGGMRSLRSQFNKWRENLQTFAEAKGVTLPNSNLLSLEYALTRLNDIKKLSNSAEYWTATGIADEKETVNKLLETAINKIQSLLEMYDEYKANTAEKEADFKNALQEAWDACDKLYDTFKSGTLAEVEAELYLYTYKGGQYACVGKLNSLATLFRSYCRGVIATFAENEGITLKIN